MPLVRIAAAVAGLCLLVSCVQAVPAHDGRIRVVTTISVLNSFVDAVGGDRVSVQSLVPVGASPETYQPTPQNVALVSDAQLLVQNGAGLETWLHRTLTNAAAPQLVVIDCSRSLPITKSNPHLWMDPVFAKTYVAAIADGLSTVDPAHRSAYAARARAYEAKLDALTVTIRARIDSVPPARRTMIVFHNAWQYYNDRFGIRTIGFIEANPGQDPNPQQLADLVDRARANDVRAIFGEPEYSGKLAQQLAASAGINVVDDLYDDSIGTDPRVRDYIGMLTYDTDVIVRAMR